MPAFDDDIPQSEKRRVVLQDADVRNQSRNTYLSHTHPEAGGRFALTERHTITGVASPAPPPLPANSPWHGSDPVPTEPPLGYRIDAMPELGQDPTGAPPVPPVATDDPASSDPSASAPAPLTRSVSERGAGSSPSSEPMAARRKSRNASNPPAVGAGAERPPARLNPWSNK